MSSRIRSGLGTLQDRVTHTPTAGAKHCLVDGTLPGIVWNWVKQPEGWVGWVAYVDTDLMLHVGPLPASRLQPATDDTNPAR